MIKPDHSDSKPESIQQTENRLHNWTEWILLTILSLEWIYLLIEARWLSVFLVTLIIITLFAPVLFRNNLEVVIPAEFHFAAVLFVFASLYLGEVQSFYQRVWWWDIALHFSAGLLMGILGFLLVYLLNESRRVDVYMTPGFIAFFAFTFAVTIGTVWEIFEFVMDQTLRTNMQKPMMGDLSGLVDTMWDMIVNSIGAFIISFMGWRYLKRNQSFFVKEWIGKFIQKNPRLFKE